MSSVRAGSGVLDAWRYLKRNRLAMGGFILIVILGVAGLLAPLLGPYPYDVPDLSHSSQGPSAGHWLGTDRLGRDLLSRLTYGARVSLAVAVTVQALTVAVGVIMGMLAGYFGGWVDSVITRLADIVFAFPMFLFALLVSAVLGPGLVSLGVAIVLAGWPEMARLIRGQVMALRDSPLAEAARAVGASQFSVMFRHILPNTLAPLIVRATMGMSSVIMIEAGMSFLGVGIQPPLPSWGSMISEGTPYLRTYPHMTIIPSIVLSLTVLAFNFFGDGLRDALDPRLKD